MRSSKGYIIVDSCRKPLIFFLLNEKVKSRTPGCSGVYDTLYFPASFSFILYGASPPDTLMAKSPGPAFEMSTGGLVGGWSRGVEGC